MVRVRVVREADWDIDSEYILGLLDLLHDASAEDTVSSQHLHLEQTVEAVLAT